MGIKNPEFCADYKTVLKSAKESPRKSYTQKLKESMSKSQKVHF